MFSNHVSTAYRLISKRALHNSRAQNAISPFTMPAMSPTMTEGGISRWRKKEGESFSSGDVLLEIETDKATMDVEAQDDGLVGKILSPDGSKNIPVGKLIALLAEEGDDISNLVAPAEGCGPALAPTNGPPSRQPHSPSSTTSLSPTNLSVSNSRPSTGPSHTRPLFPSVLRLLQENALDKLVLKGTGVRGMLRKGDVLAHIGKASSPWGTAEDPKTEPSIHSPAPGALKAALVAKTTEKVLDADSVRRMIVAELVGASSPPLGNRPKGVPLRRFCFGCAYSLFHFRSVVL
ncbi:hypothetical protein BS47DRAFT_494276 [Hydnum rufescens UP504]|uniref:Uncharacterized protein n=1 Tax=Hydnum rufescens UP504 TaxID=1448309 RepID=A0A9P6AHV3_9AGAM|nr:hypothetical protein BS47DRAFT_494276 [Hydnum rufescens UP504]